MSFVREIVDANIKKEKSEEVKEFEANVSNCMGATQEDTTT